ISILKITIALFKSKGTHCLDIYSRKMLTSIKKIKDAEFKIPSEIMSVILTKPVELIYDVFEREDFEIRIVGGAVRDILLGKTPKDIDFATTAKPHKIKDICHNNDIKCIETGFEHGTLTAVIEKNNYEITTLRNDVETNGRHAKVEFIQDWKLDAQRRDLTFNAMSLSRKGVLYDYFNGTTDLFHRNVQFVNNPEIRIKEDYLRILRFFRFYGKIADKPAYRDSFDENLLRLIYDLSPNLTSIAIERIWTEVSQILVGNFAPSILAIINDLNILKYCRINCSHKLNTERFNLYYNNCLQRSENADIPDVEACSLLSALFDDFQNAQHSCQNLKLSCSQRNTCLFLVKNRRCDAKLFQKDDFSLDYYKSLLVLNYKPQEYPIILSNAIQLMLCECAKNEDIIFIQNWEIPQFPLKGDQLKKYCVGSEISQALLALKQKWIQSDFKDTNEQLMKYFMDNINK
ncbi:hypothetical protein MXB_1976, partial [Myxobolus squamalis]